MDELHYTCIFSEIRGCLWMMCVAPLPPAASAGSFIVSSNHYQICGHQLQEVKNNCAMFYVQGFPVTHLKMQYAR